MQHDSELAVTGLLDISHKLLQILGMVGGITIGGRHIPANAVALLLVIAGHSLLRHGKPRQERKEYDNDETSGGHFIQLASDFAN